jgi:hypothetical protein
MEPNDYAAGPTGTDASPGRTAAEVEAEWRAATIPVLRSRPATWGPSPLLPILRFLRAEPGTVREEPLLDEDGLAIGSAKWRVEADGFGPVWCEVTDGAAVRRLLDATKAGHAVRVANGTAEPMRVYKLDDEGRAVAVGDLDVCDG